MDDDNKNKQMVGSSLELIIRMSSYIRATRVVHRPFYGYGRMIDG